MPERYTLRSDLLIHPRQEGDCTVYVVKDPYAGRFFQLREPEHFLVTQMNGKTTVEEAEARFSARFGIQLAPGAAAAFFQKMQRLCLFEGIYAEAALSRRARHGGPPASSWRRILHWRIAVFNPDRWLGRLERRTRWMFTPEFLCMAVPIIAVSILVAAANRMTFFIGLGEIIQVGSIIGILAALFVLAASHEFAHAVALKHYGGSVTEMGFLLLYFQPCVYSNLSDAYLLPARRQKSTVMLAGLFVQLLVTAAAIFIWRVTEIGNLINRFAFLVAAVSLAIVLFNVNPLIKLDGYYLLADWLRLPNLRSRAFRYLKRRFIAWSTIRQVDLETDDRHGRVFFWYGIVALSYSAVLLVFVGYHVTAFLAKHLGWAGPLVLWGAVGIIAARPLWRTSPASSADEKAAAASSAGQTRHTPAGQSAAATGGSEPAPKARRRWAKRPLIFWGIIVLVLLSTFVIHAERRMGSACRVEPSAVFTVTNPEAGVVEAQLYETGSREQRRRTTLQLASSDFSAVNLAPRFAEGDRVNTGDTILVISSNRYTSQFAATSARLGRARAELDLLYSGPKEEQIRQLRAELAQVEAQLANQEAEFARAGRMHERKLSSDEEFDLARTRLDIAREGKKAKQSELALLVSKPKLEEIAVKEAEINELSAQVEYYRSQMESSVFVAPFAGRVSWARQGKTIFEMVRTDTVRVVIPTAEMDIGDVHIGAPVRLKVRSYPFDTFEGRVARLAIAAPDSGSTRSFEVVTAIPNPGGRLLSGMTGYAKISCGRRPLISLILRRVVHFFRVEFWSWW